MSYIGNPPAERFTSFDYQDLTGGSGTSFTLTHPVGNAQEILVMVNNVVQEPGVAYTVSGTGLTMTGSIASTDDFYVVYRGKAIQTATHPSDRALTATDGTFTGDASVTGDLTVDTNTLKVDSTNNRLGVGVASPSQKLHVEGTGTQFLFLNNSTTNDGLYLKAGSGAVSLQTGGGGHTMNFFTSGTERLRVLSGGGLTFNGDTAAANALDDYEQGTWTPSVGGSATYTTQAGHYIKIGDMVFITGSLIINNISGAAHTNYLDGLPYNSVTGVGREGHVSVQYFANLASTGTYFALRTNGDRLYGSAQRENDNTMVVNVDIFQNSTEVTFGGSYFVA